MIQTNWIVITGVPCSGKTSLVKRFAEYGFKGKEEIARNYIGEMMKKGISPDELKKDRKIYFEKLFELQIKFEQSILHFSDETVFLDRSIPDILAYSFVDCFETIETQKIISNSHRYKKIFVLDPLPFVDDGFRSNNLARREKLNEAFESAYKSLSYDVVRLPVLPIDDRLELVLKEIKYG